jgi:23S rRNA (pseudouridine1915-N3)-methyltransferase
MKIGIAAIGLLKSGHEMQLAADYEQRITGLGRTAGFTGLNIQDWAESKSATAALRKAEEAKRLWSAVPADGFAVVLDERGKAMDSADFAKLLQSQAQSGTKQLLFLIGGPDGHAAETRTRAFQTLSFGPMTFPHRLLRVMLLEQIYRAVTIIVNHPYHRA